VQFVLSKSNIGAVAGALPTAGRRWRRSLWEPRYVVAGLAWLSREPEGYLPGAARPVGRRPGLITANLQDLGENEAMRNLMLAAAGTAALLVSAGAALAAQATGTITVIEWATGTVELDNGNTYIVPNYLQSQFPLHLGQKVTVTVDDSGGKMVSAIKAAS
jgi:hypothetical protein